MANGEETYADKLPDIFLMTILKYHFVFCKLTKISCKG